MCKHGTGIVVAFVLAVAGCASSGSSRRAASAFVNGPPSGPAYVPRGTEFMAALDGNIGSDRSRVGQRFTLRLLEPLPSTDPKLVIPAGSRIDGEVVGVDPGYLPDVRILLRQIQTPFGRLPIHATLRYAGRSAWVNPHPLYDPEMLGYDSILYHPFYRPDRAMGSAVGGGPPPALDDPVEPIRLPPGSEVELVLMRPLMLRVR